MRPTRKFAKTIKEKNMDSIKLIEQLTTTPGISGYEKKIRNIMCENLKNSDEQTTDRMGSVAFKYNSNKTDAPAIAFIAHMDEVGFLVADILENGLIKVQNIGGWSPLTLLSSPVEILNDESQNIQGIFSSIPVHFLGNQYNNMTIENLTIDIGASSKKEVIEKFGISLGSPVTPKTNFCHVKQTDRIISKAFDNRIGVASVIELGKSLNSAELQSNVICGATVQEEVGTRGAQLFTNMVKPDVVFVVEGPPADDTIASSGAQTALGKGVHLRLYDPTMLAHPGVIDFVKKTAADSGIPVQPTVRRRGGTDAGKIHLTHNGIPSVVIGVPVRYAHSHNGIIDLKDYKNLVKLMQAICKNFNKDTLKAILEF